MLEDSAEVKEEMSNETRNETNQNTEKQNDCKTCDVNRQVSEGIYNAPCDANAMSLEEM